MEEVRAIFRGFVLVGAAIEQPAQAVIVRLKAWVSFMMRDALGLEQPDTRRALHSALNIRLVYVRGGAAAPLRLQPESALPSNVLVNLMAPQIFGAVKTRFTKVELVRAAVQAALVGGLSAGADLGAAQWLSSLG